MVDDDPLESTDSLLAAIAAIPERELPGTQIGRYRIERRLGEGGMGIVFAALDPELDRKVAVKLLRARPASTSSLADRLRREAQALAKLSHPNVVTVYDVGVAEGELYIVMQLVDGTTLGEHLADHPHRQLAIVELFAAAGRGLAAAHAAGIVHRDFKPANVLVDRDGTVRVSDFGLARDGVGGRPIARDDSAGIGTTLTTSGLVGTPAYMAPEQFEGRAVTPATDQFAFCVALWEALYGARPFRGDTLGALAEAVTAGHREEPPAGKGVPRRLHAALARGLERDADARWPSMAALVAELEAGPRRRRRVAIGAAIAGAVALSAGGAWALASRRPAADPCTGAGQRLAGVWDPARREHARARVLAADPIEGAARFAIAAPLLDGYANDWRSMHVDACRANRVTGAQNDALYARRVACLDRKRADLDSAAAALDGASNLAAVDRAMVTVHQLPDLAPCADADALLAALPLPDDPAVRRAVAAADALIDAVEADRRAGKLTGLDDREAIAVEAARKTTYSPVLARALRVRARIALDVSNATLAATILRELTDVAAVAKDDVDAAWAWSQLLITVGWDLSKPAEGVALLPAAHAALLRAGNGLDARVDYLYSSSAVLFNNRREPEAYAALAEARKLLEAAGAGAPGSPRSARLGDVLFEHGTLTGTAGQHELSGSLMQAAIERWTQAYGPDHPELAFGWQGVGDALRLRGKGEDAVRAYNEAIRIRSARMGDDPALAKTLVTLAAALVDLGRVKEAVAPIDHAVAILRKSGSQQDLATALMMQSSVYDDHLDQALALSNEAIALFEAAGGIQNELPVALNNRGGLYIAMNKYELALADMLRAIDLVSRDRGSAHPTIVDELVTAGGLLIELHRPAEALPLLDRALGIRADGIDAGAVGSGKFYRGRALVDSGKDRAGGYAQVKAARAELKALTGPQIQARIDELDEWLRKHPE